MATLAELGFEFGSAPGSKRCLGRTETHRKIRSGPWSSRKGGLAQQEELLAELDAKIEEHTRPFAAEIVRLDVIPGVDHRLAEVLLAAVGADIKPFPSDEHLSSWAGMCPGKKKAPGSGEGGASRPATVGSRKLWYKPAASHTKNTYLASQFRRWRGTGGIDAL